MINYMLNSGMFIKLSQKRIMIDKQMVHAIPFSRILLIENLWMYR